MNISDMQSEYQMKTMFSHGIFEVLRYLTKQNGSKAFIAGNMSSIYVLSHRVLVVYILYCLTTPLLDNTSTMLLVLLP